MNVFNTWINNKLKLKRQEYFYRDILCPEFLGGVYFSKFKKFASIDFQGPSIFFLIIMSVQTVLWGEGISPNVQTQGTLKWNEIKMKNDHENPKNLLP